MAAGGPVFIFTCRGAGAGNDFCVPISRLLVDAPCTLLVYATFPRPPPQRSLELEEPRSEPLFPIRSSRSF